MKKCPFCKEEIQDDAVKCRFCGEYLTQEAKSQKNKKIAKSFLVGCLVLVIIFILINVVIMFVGFKVVKHITENIRASISNATTHQTQPLPQQVESIFRQFMDIIQQFIGQLKDFFQGANGVKTL